MGFTYTRGRSITDFVQNAQEAVEPAMKTMAEDAVSMMLRIVKENAPVDTHDLRNSITKYPIVALPGGMGFEGGVFTEIEYGAHVEHGTGLWGPEHRKYKIEPKDPNGVLAFFMKGTHQTRLDNGQYSANITEGKTVFARYVMHPGSPGAFMFTTGVAYVEASFDEATAKGLNEWKQRAERF